MTTPQDPAQVNQVLKIAQVKAILTAISSGYGTDNTLNSLVLQMDQNTLNTWALKYGVTQVPVTGP
jgi:hypothetical protein